MRHTAARNGFFRVTTPTAVPRATAAAIANVMRSPTGGHLTPPRGPFKARATGARDASHRRHQTRWPSVRSGTSLGCGASSMSLV